MISQDLLDILRCPFDPSKTGLALQRDHLHQENLVCTRCGLKFPIRDGLPNMVVEEAELPPNCESLDELPCRKELRMEN
jgi:uncharacterized protein